MNEGTINQIRKGFETAFINGDAPSNLAYKPQFISNNYKEGRKVVTSLEEELLNCEEFSICVAFITMGGITALLQTLKELETKKIPGRVLTTDYMNFSDPRAIRKLNELENIRVRMYRTNEAPEGFHTKGYIFRANGIYRILVGSSNMTQSALTKNREWNTKITSTEQGEYTKQIIEEFEQLWVSQYTKDYEHFIDNYTIMYKAISEQKSVKGQPVISNLERHHLEPNKMQIEFIKNLQKIRQEGREKALLISATGTGKTYASAFALRAGKIKKALFLVHREQIAKQAMDSYKKVFGENVSFGLLSGNTKNYEADYLFSTMQMMAKEETLAKFQRDEFDTIIIDEVHRAGAYSYQRIMSYFRPEFWLGMTASPDRGDGFDIYNLFDHNIAYEIRLQQALEEDLLCPFHYFGISELEINGQVFDDFSSIRNFASLTCDDRVEYVLEKANYYGYSGERVKGLIFCSRREEAVELSKKFNVRGYKTEFLCGDDSQGKREECIERLVGDSSNDYLDYIFTIDIFNEGIDIPEVNQVIMLRPTESPVIFIQQLGRGLRKADGKEYVVVLDFIGNYMNNFMIPVALYGDRTYNKDTMRRYIMEGSRTIPGSSTIHFDEISRKRIFQSIDNVTTKKALLKEKYQNLKNRLGKVPTILEFYYYGDIDPILIINYAKTYDRFVRMVDRDYTITFDPQQEAILEFVSSLLVSGKRPHELIMLKMLIAGEIIEPSSFRATLESSGSTFAMDDYRSAIRVLKKDFLNTQSEKTRYADIEFFNTEKMKAHMVERANDFFEKLRQAAFCQELNELVEYGLKKYKDYYADHDEDNLVLYQKYSRKDVCRILNWDKDDSSTMYGYRIKYGTCPIFVTYEKKEDIASSTKYEDQFVDNHIFSWMTRSKVSIESSEVQQLIHYREKNLRIYLFIKKSDGEGSDFYYLGRVHPIKWNETTIENDKGQILPIVNFQMELEHSVRTDIYDYFTK